MALVPVYLLIGLAELLLLVTAFAGMFQKTEKFIRRKKWFRVSFLITEIVFIALAPPLGIHLSQDDCGDHPFFLSQILTPYICWAFPAAAYFISAYGKKLLSPLLIFLSSTLVLFGFIYCIVTVIHFGEYLLYAWFPFTGLLLLSPVMCALYLGRELANYSAWYRINQEEKNIAPTNTLSRICYRILNAPFWKRNLIISSFFLPVTVLLQALLYLFGQAPDSMITQFTESCGFLLSNHQQCTCGGHYLCSVAAFGDEKLVKPVRYGKRHGKTILVNRQLLIANAFENWFEEYTPRFAKLMRRTYDACNIPADKWARNKTVANVFFIAMKPAEWFFLLWLYTFDNKPESRIHKQYLPEANYDKTIHS